MKKLSKSKAKKCGIKFGQVPRDFGQLRRCSELYDGGAEDQTGVGTLTVNME